VGLILEVPQGYSIERLNTAFHRRDGFSCGIEALDTFLETQASQAQNKNISTTHVLLEETEQLAMDRPIIGYVTLTPATIPLVDAPRSLKRIAKGTEIQAQLILGGHLKTGHRWTLQNRPTKRTQNKSIYTVQGRFLQSIFS
jgi:hypothetical protein